MQDPHNACRIHVRKKEGYRIHARTRFARQRQWLGAKMSPMVPSPARRGALSY
jgi:hypothetical protein